MSLNERSKHRPTPISEEHRELAETHSFAYSYWLGFLAGTLVRVTRAATFREAKRTAREGLGSLTDPRIGATGLDWEAHRIYREAAHEPEEEDEDE